MNKTITALLSVTALTFMGAVSVAQAQGRHPHVVSPVATPNLQPLQAPQLNYRFVQGPQAPGDHKFGNVSSSGLLPNGNLVVFNRNPEIMMTEYDPSGKFIRTFNPGMARFTHGLRVDRDGNIWATDTFLNMVWKLNIKGEPLMTLGTYGEVEAWDDAKWNGKFNQPTDLNFDQDGNIYVVQGHGGTAGPSTCTYCATYTNSNPPVPPGSDPRILKFDRNGKFLKSLALPHADGTYPTIHTVVVTHKGEIWLSDRQLNKIIVLDRELNRLREIQQPTLVSGLFVGANGQIWMSSGMDGMLMKLDENGKIIGWIGTAGRVQDPNSNLIGEAHFLVVTPDEQTIYLADSVNAKIHRLERN
jgi:streptogramin lyase